MQSLEDIPKSLQEPVAGALLWVNSQENASFELTGLLDADAAEGTTANEPFELGLVLCDGEICDRQQILFTPADNGYSYSYVAEGERDIPELLDPPAGVRASWLDDVLKKHEFVLLLFYRGLW